MTESLRTSPVDHDARPGVGAVIRARREAIGMTIARAAELSGCAKSYLSLVETGQRRAPGDALLERLELALMVSAGSLVEAARWERSLEAGGEVVRDRIEQLEQDGALARELRAMLARGAGRGGETALDRLFRSGDLRRLVERMSTDDDALKTDTGAHDQCVTQGAPQVGLAREVPIINKVAAGYPAEFTDLGYPARIADDYIRVPDATDPDAFAARIVGDSMLPTYAQGDLVVFSPGTPVRSGMDCFVRLEPDHESTFKRVYFESGNAGEPVIRLQPLNSDFPPRVVPREQVAGLYAATSLVRPILPDTTTKTDRG